MDSLTIAAASGLRSRMQSLDLLANNLANSATAGFKRDQEFYGLYSANDSESTLPVIQKQWTDFSTGTVQVTGNPLNVALSGKGFFAVNGPSGALYTRNGNLQVLPSGQLATSDGYALRKVGGGTLQIASGKAIDIGKDGTVSQEGQSVGQIEIVNFKSTDSLSKLGATCFQSGDPANAPAPAADIEVQQGKLEGSNVPVAEGAMRLVSVMRQFEMLQKAIGISGEMDSKSIQEVARITS